MSKSIKVTAVLMLMMLFAASCTKPDVPNNDENDNGQNDSIVEDSIIFDGYNYVDLGLPSGTLWATCNVGANSPEKFGDYFAWGETTPKNLYDWKSYKYSAFVDGRYVLTKYCTNSYYGLDGLVDSLTVLDPMDDAAVANWGEHWRMPTGEEWSELYQNTTLTWTTQNDVDGILLTSWNGNSIFLPNTGFYLDDSLFCTSLGVYWSSSLQTSSQISAWSFHYDLDECHVCGTYERSRGQVVRAVHRQ